MPRIGGIAALDDIVPGQRTISTTPPLLGGGDLTVDRVLSLQVGTTAGTVAAGNDTRLNDARAWNLYTGTATVGQVPTWDATSGRFMPQTPTSGGVDAETVRDIVGATLVGGDNVSVTVDDPGDTVTISAAGGAGGTVTDATTTTKGIIQLAGDLGGTAGAPTVPGAQKTTQKSTAATPVADGYIGADSSGKVAAALLPAATTTTSGIVQLAGDLGGTASAPVIIRRGPLGGHTQVTYTATITLNAAAGNSFYVSATGNVTVAAPTGTAADGQRILLEVYASGATRLVTISGPTVLAGLATTMNVTSGKIGLVGMYYSSRAGHWTVAAMAAEA